MLALLLTALSLAGTLQVDCPPGHVVKVDGQVRTYDDTGLIQVQLPAGTHSVRVRRILGRRFDTRVDVPDQGTVRVVLRGGSLVQAPPLERATRPAPTSTTAPASGPLPADDLQIPARAVRAPLTSQGFRIPIGLGPQVQVQGSLDTGANKLGLCPELARQAGFVHRGSADSITPSATVRVLTGSLPRVELAGHTLRDVPALVYPDLPCDLVMVGVDTLDAYNVVLRDQALHVWSGAPRATPGSKSFYLDNEGALAVWATVGGVRTPLLLDTGATRMGLRPDVARASGARQTGETGRFMTATGIVESPYLQVPQVIIEGAVLTDVLASTSGPHGDPGRVGRVELVELARQGLEFRFSEGRAALHRQGR